ncbi:pentatricopeptide repeat-containing protein At1g63070, mitochondrial-like [Cynara cardunculus var. scolymus]|uniref:pentatricopeptide repeat-containing protein At1g63070, mitochondrial-like n=1 Tax=Cynara cardunculus var. scolymus TaxID=59895 RepID=UPI000D62B7D8|nr:pentatricopeptide repeat-containing protein At1g63070, mitochondrial-like [Cynara cardunculus var. scolymus]
MIFFPVKRICKKVQFFSQFMSLSSSSSSSVVQSLDMAEEDNPHCPNYGELRTKMQNLTRSGSIGKALEIFHLMRNVSGKPTVYDYNSLINCYLKSNKVGLHDLCGLYFEMKRVELHPNASTFNTFLKGLSLLGESKVAISVIVEMCNYGFTPSFSCLSNLLKKCLDSMELVDGLRVLDLMLGLNYIPTEPKVILLINSLSRCGMTRDACVVFFKLLEIGNFQSPYVYNPILWSLCKSDQISGALAFFCSLKKKGLVHNVCSYTALVYGFGQKGLFKEASGCLRIMEVDGGCYPNIKTYTTIIKCLCDGGRIKEALCALGEMEKKGFDPDIVTYNIILRALSHKNLVLEIYNLYHTIYQKGLSPDNYTATAFSGLLKRGNIGIALNLLRDIVSSDSDVDVAVYNVYLHCLFRAREFKESLFMISCMEKDGIKPNNITFNTILKGICEEKTVDKALEFFERVEWPGKRPDMVSFNTVLSVACKRGDSIMVQTVLNLMEDEGVKLNVVGFTCLMQYFCNIGNINDCLKLFEHMISHGPHPSMVTINTLMVVLCKNRELGAAYQVFSNLKSYGLSPDARTYGILIRAAMNEGNNLLVTELQRKFAVNE